MKRDIYPVQLMMRRNGTKNLSNLSIDETINILIRATNEIEYPASINLRIIGIGKYLESIVPICSVAISESLLSDLKRGSITMSVFEFIEKTYNTASDPTLYGKTSGTIPIITPKTDGAVYNDSNNIRTYETINYVSNINTTFANSFISDAISSVLPNELFWDNIDDTYQMRSGFYDAILSILERSGLMKVEITKGANIVPLSDFSVANISITPTDKLETIPDNIQVLEIIGYYLEGVQ